MTFGKMDGTMCVLTEKLELGYASLAPEAQEQDSRTDQPNTDPVQRDRALSQEDRRKEGDEDDAELVDWGHPRGIPNLQSSKVADPRRSSGEARQDEEEQGAGQELSVTFTPANGANYVAATATTQITVRPFRGPASGGELARSISRARSRHQVEIRGPRRASGQVPRA